MDRAETTGLGVAVIGHVALFGLLTYLALTPPELPKIISDPIEVDLVSEVDLMSSAPAPAPPAPASEPPATAEPEPALPPPEPESPPPLVIKPQPAPKPVAKTVTVPKPVPVPKPVAKPAAKPVAKPSKPVAKPTKPVVADARDRRRPGLSRDLLAGLSDAPTNPRPATPTAKPGVSPAAKPTTATGVNLAQMTGAQKSSLNAKIYAQLKPHWKPPSGSDAELLVTRLSVRLNRDGSLAETPEVLGQDGINDSNRAQAKLHVERAIQAVRRAAPFQLPAEYYDAWKWLKPLKLYVGQPG